MDFDYRYTIDDLAERFSVTTETVRRWCREKRIGHIKLPGKKGGYRFSKEDVDNFIAYRNTQPIFEVYPDLKKEDK